MTVADFIAKWRHHDLRERAAAQEHFIDLCHLVGHPTPAQADPEGRWFTFERGAAKATGGDGWADAWKKDHFGWEYKGPKADLAAAYRQLLLYFGALENPPLLVTCDTDRIMVHTHFPGTPTTTHELTLEGLADTDQFAVLHAVFHAPDRLRPEKTVQKITEEAAEKITEIAQALRSRDIPAQKVARFLDRVVFCLFAEDVGLLPARLFTKVIENTQPHPEQFKDVIGKLFGAMAHGGHFGAEKIAHFNGDLFDDGDVLDVTANEMRVLREVTDLDWSAIDASIFGTLFERALDPDKRSQLGAHYTSREDIETLIEPVVMAPLRREWDAVRAEITKLLDVPVFTKARRDKASQTLRGFQNRLQSVTVLDPACGSGNFLFVTLQKLKDLEKEVLVFAATLVGGLFPGVNPRQLAGIELNKYAHELAQMTVWIGYLQWVKKNGFGDPEEPILQRMTTFENKDAVSDLQPDAVVSEPEWPATEFIVSNPPFLGRAKLREFLGDEYVEALYTLWGGRVPGEADYCCYWFEKARAQIEAGKTRRAGLLATQSIRAGANREVLDRISQTGGIFFGESDRPWVLDGAAVRVAMVGFDNGTETSKLLDRQPVTFINADLTTGLDLTRAVPLAANDGICIQGPVKVGDFDIDFDAAVAMLQAPNPHGRPNSDVVRPWLNGRGITDRNPHKFIIDFGERSRVDAALYEAPYRHVEQFVKPSRINNRDTQRRERWWLLGRVGTELRAATRELSRMVCTPRVAKHRLFVWADTELLPDARLYAFARDDDWFFGVLHSRPHKLWSLAKATWHGVGNDPTYAAESCFETFPFPELNDDQRRAIADVSRRLLDLRNRWLNPPEWIQTNTITFLASTDGPWRHTVQNAGPNGIGVARYAQVLPVDEDTAKLLKKRTLTALYNENPAWLRELHEELDRVVIGAYELPADAEKPVILERLLTLNAERAR